VWDPVRGTRVNQDHQREIEDCSLADIARSLARHHEKQAPLPRDNFMKQMTESSNNNGESRQQQQSHLAGVVRNDSAGKQADRQLSRTDSQLMQLGGSFTRYRDHKIYVVYSFAIR
jgi:hypothetical protein